MEETYKINRIRSLEDQKKDKEGNLKIYSVIAVIEGICSGHELNSFLDDPKSGTIRLLLCLLFSGVSIYCIKEVYKASFKLGQIDEELKTLRG